METKIAMNQVEKARQRIAEKEIDAALITNIENVRWMTGFSGSSGFIVLTKGGGVFISDSRYREQAHEQVDNLPVQIFQTPVTAAEKIAEEARKLGVSRLAFEAEHVTFAAQEDWAKKMEGIELYPVRELADQLRMVKSPEEIDKIRQACGIADACFDHVLRMMQQGVTEYDICLDIEFFIRRQGAKIAFPPIVVSGPRSARPHGEPSERKLEKGDFVTMDFGAQVDGYNSDITRTVVIGEASDRHREVYDAVLKAQVAAIEAAKPGVPARELDALTRDILGERDLAKYFGHGLGHGLGRVVHDIGSMNAQSKHVLEPGQVWTIEPGVYIEGFGGVRIEDDIVITDDGCDVLTKSPKELTVL